MSESDTTENGIEIEGLDLSRRCSCQIWPRPIICYACAIRSLLILLLPDLSLRSDVERQQILQALQLNLAQEAETTGPQERRANHVSASRNHREGAELGYAAGEEAYQQTRQKYGFNGQPLGFLTVPSFQDLMDYYLDQPRYRPRQITSQIIEEWRALFLFAWSHQVMQAHPQLLQGGREK